MTNGTRHDPCIPRHWAMRCPAWTLTRTSLNRVVNKIRPNTNVASISSVLHLVWPLAQSLSSMVVPTRSQNSSWHSLWDLRGMQAPKLRQSNNTLGGCGERGWVNGWMFALVEGLCEGFSRGDAGKDIHHWHQTSHQWYSYNSRRQEEEISAATPQHGCRWPDGGLPEVTNTSNCEGCLWRCRRSIWLEGEPQACCVAHSSSLLWPQESLRLPGKTIGRGITASLYCLSEALWSASSCVRQTATNLDWDRAFHIGFHSTGQADDHMEDFHRYQKLVKTFRNFTLW